MEERMPRKLAAILYADVVGYSRLTGEDEEGTHRRLSEYLDLISAFIEQHNGGVVHYAGDAVLADFGTASDSLTCAVAIQRDLASRNETLPDDRKLHFRVGVNLGEVIVDRNDIYGDGVNVAARLESLARPGGICISDAVRSAIGNKLAFEYEFMGEQRVKNIAEPVRTYRVRMDDVAAESFSSTESLELPEKPSIAVLAFDNMSNDPEQSYFSDGVAEDIITDLSKISSLFVVARNSTFAYKDQHVNVQEVGRQLGVRYVLEGSVRKAGNRLRITAQLIDTATGGHLWAERYDRDLTDIFEVQDEVTRKIVTALLPRLSPEDKQRTVSRVTGNMEAYDYFLRGRDQDVLDTRDANASARSMLGKAIELDPEFSLAHSYLARNYLISYNNRWGDDPEQSLKIGMELAQRAIALDKYNAHAHYAYAAAATWSKQHDQALVEAREAIAIDPNFSLGHEILGFTLLYIGQPREAIAAIQLAMRLDPLFRDVILHILAQAYYQLGEYEQAVAALKRRLIRKPESDISRVLLAASYGQLGEAEKGRMEWAHAIEVNPEYSLEHRRRVLPYKNPKDFEHIVEGLRKAGVEN
ncbi:MAG: adenylate/guanylate cyclase domain-containing protein [Gammaproteobacteria bacterium]